MKSQYTREQPEAAYLFLTVAASSRAQGHFRHSSFVCLAQVRRDEPQINAGAVDGFVA